MTDRLIIIKGAPYSKVKKALEQWIESYSKDLSKSILFELYDFAEEQQFIKVDKNLDNDRFFYLINYLNYPQNIKYNVIVEGNIIGKEGKIKNQELLIYISDSDTEYDNVFAVNKENQNFKIDFGGKITVVNNKKKYSVINTPILSNPEIFNPKKVKKEHLNENKWFNIKLLIALTLLGINLIIPLFTNNIKVFQNTSLFIYIGTSAWFMMEFERPRSNKFFIKCLLISIGVFVYGLFLKYFFEPNLSDTIFPFAHFPFFLLVTMWPARKVYKSIFKREPIITRNGKVADTIYSMIIFIGGLLFSILISHYAF